MPSTAQGCGRAPGSRSSTAYCSHVQIVGYVPAGGRLRLVMASQREGELAYVGMVELGLGSRVRQLVAARRLTSPPFRLRNVCWIRPLTATVDHGPSTADGRLREPVLRSVDRV